MNQKPFMSKKTVLIGLGLLVVAILIIVLVNPGGKTNQPPPNAAKETPGSLIDWLPWQTSDYKIAYSYDPTTKNYTYQVTLYAIINRPSQYDSYLAQLRQYKHEALNYIKSKGTDPSKLTIQYLPPEAAGL